MSAFGASMVFLLQEISMVVTNMVRMIRKVDKRPVGLEKYFMVSP
jgi:hypothetical protein